MIYLFPSRRHRGQFLASLENHLSATKIKEDGGKWKEGREIYTDIIPVRAIHRKWTL